MEVKYQVEYDPKTELGLKRLPDEIMYTIARETLERADEIIPKDTTTMEKTMLSAGVRGSNGEYYIGSYTRYASRVYMFNDSTTNWTTPGTHSQWFARATKQYGKGIIENAINQEWRKVM